VLAFFNPEAYIIHAFFMQRKAFRTVSVQPAEGFPLSCRRLLLKEGNRLAPPSDLAAGARAPGLKKNVEEEEVRWTRR
jgi:hypothetical protein